MLDVSHIGRYFPPETDLSLADKVARLPPDDRDRILAEFDAKKLKYDFGFWGRDSQLEVLKSVKPTVAFIGGRGAGKTRVVAEKVHSYAMDNPGCRILLVARTAADGRDIIVRGESGILSVGQPTDRPRYVPGLRRLSWANGSEALVMSADNPDALRGVQSHLTVCDELGSWPNKSTTGLATAFENARIATRLGPNPQMFISTTPRRVPAVIALFEQALEKPKTIEMIRTSTRANRHLAEVYLSTIEGLYDGTAMARQELDGELLMDVDGALMSMQTIDDARDFEPPDIMSLPLRAIGVDPSVAERPRDECGIVICGASGERELYKRHAWVYHDESVLGEPKLWADRVIRLARRYNAVVVAEVNQGYQLVYDTLKSIDPTVPVVKVKATQGKRLRAEPISLAYQQERVHHTDYFGLLEDQLTAWDFSQPSGGAASESKSPDRLDALVWGLAAMLVNVPAEWANEIRVSSLAARSTSLPGVRKNERQRVSNASEDRAAELASLPLPTNGGKMGTKSSTRPSTKRAVAAQLPVRNRNTGGY